MSDIEGLAAANAKLAHALDNCRRAVNGEAPKPAQAEGLGEFDQMAEAFDAMADAFRKAQK